jgi:Flp pilus assembly protein TadD
MRGDHPHVVVTTAPNPWSCTFQLYPSGETPGPRLSIEEVIAFLRGRSAPEMQELLRRALKRVASICSHNGQLEAACYYIWQLITFTADAQERAAYLLWLGREMERRDDYVDAVACYRKARQLEPEDRRVRYWISSNLGYSLNQLGKFAEAEPFCREAVSTDSTRPEGHTNLGLSLLGQGRLLDAARCFVHALEVQPDDSRPAEFLQMIFRRHPDVRRKDSTVDRKANELLGRAAL